MRDPYEVLGISSNASDEEAKQAYRALARKYHPDNYQNNPLADLAEEKMKEVNEAYEAINKMRSGGGYSQNAAGSAGGYGYAGQSYGQGYGYNASYGGGQGQFAQVRQYINMGNLDTAEQILQGTAVKNGEWYFLMGSIAYRRGWLDEARQNYQIACQMEPGNMEYMQALRMMQQGGYGYRPDMATGSSCDSMDCCTAMLCMNCLCGGCN